MSAIHFEHENNSNYMCILVHEQTQQNDYQIKMIEKNKIPALLPLQIRQMNNKIYYYYEITARQQMSKLFEYSKIKQNDLDMILHSFSLLSKSVNEYMLDLDLVILNPENIFIDLANRQLSFAYYPQIDGMTGFDAALKKLFEYILEHYDHNTGKEELMQVYDIYQKIVQRQYHVERLEELLDSKHKDGKEKIPEKNYLNYDFLKYENSEVNDEQEHQDIIIESVPCEKILEEKEVYDLKFIILRIIIQITAGVLIVISMMSLLLPNILPFTIKGSASIICLMCGVFMNLGVRYLPDLCRIKLNKYLQPFIMQKNKDCSLKKEQTEEDKLPNMQDVQSTQETEAETHTMLLSEYINRKNHIYAGVKLISQDDNDDILIEQYPYMIGSLASRCNFTIKNEFISRVHVCVLKVDDLFYIEDMNSTNGTFLNDIQMQMGSREEIKTGDEVKLAVLSYMVEIT